MRELPTQKIPWYPYVDLDSCMGCQECYNFCGNGVYDWDSEESHPIIARPSNCVVGCRACANLCTMDAISFPSREEIRETQARLRATPST